jgi:hypothetical protein
MKPDSLSLKPVRMSQIVIAPLAHAHPNVPRNMAYYLVAHRVRTPPSLMISVRLLHICSLMKREAAKEEGDWLYASTHISTLCGMLLEILQYVVRRRAKSKNDYQNLRRQRFVQCSDR